MSRNVTFSITPDGKAGINHLDQFLKRLDRISRHPAFRNISKHLTQQQRNWVQVRNHMRDATRDYNKLALAANRWKQAQQGIGKTNVKIVNQTRNIARATSTANASAKGMQRTWQMIRKTVVDVASNVGKLSARGLLQGTASLRGGATSIAGSVQGVGISTRMSGIAFGQQIGQVMAGPLSGNITSAIIQGLRGALNITAGIATIALELGTRIATGVAGGLIKSAGLIAGGAMQAVTSALSGIVAMVSGPAGLIMNSLGGALNNIVASASTIAGEMVGQIGNVLTGLGEMFRGAFQAAVNVAAGVLNGLVSIAQGVVEKVGGVMGTIGKAVTGIAGTIGGFALRDIFKGEGALTRGFVLLDPSVTSEQRDSLRAWAFNIRRELGNITAADPGKAVERAISTGFQKDPAGAQAFATNALRLVSVVGDEDAGVITRAAAKVWMAFKDELISQAGSTEGGMSLLFDKLFAVKNFGDLDLGDVAVRIGDVEGPAKALNITLDEMLTTISRLSLILGKEQTFTAFGQLMTTFTKMGPKAFGELSRQGIATRDLSGGETARIGELTKQRDAILGQSRAYKDLGHRLRDLRLRKKELKAADRDTKGVDAEILKVEKQRAVIAKQEGGTRVKALNDEIARIETMGGKLRNVLDIWNEILSKLSSGQLNETSLSRIIPNIRALRGMLGLDVLQRVAPKENEEVSAGIANAAGSVEAGLGVRSEDFGTKMLKVLAEIKQPFVQFWLTNREAVNGFVDGMTQKLRGFNEWWKTALEAQGATEFAENLGGKLSDLFSFLPENGKVEVDEFWDAMNDGLNTAWDFGKGVAGVLGDIVKGIDSGAKSLGGWGSIWEGIKNAATGVAGEIKAMASGDFSTWTEMWERGKVLADELWFSIRSKGVEAFGILLAKVDEFGNKVETWVEKLKNGLASGIGALGVYALAGSFGGRGAAAALGGGGSAGGGAAAALGGGAAARSVGHLGGAGRFLGPLGAGLSAYEAFSVLGGTPDAQQRSMGQSASTIGSFALTGAALGGPIGAGIGGLAGVAIDQIDRHKRSKAIQQQALAQRRAAVLSPLAEGRGYYNPVGGHFTSFNQHRGPNKDLLDAAGGAIGSLQMTAMNSQASPTARAAAQALIDQVYDELLKKIEARAATASEAQSRAAAASILAPVRTEVMGLAAQFPEDETLRGLRAEVGRLADALGRTGADRSGVRATAAGLARRAQAASGAANARRAAATPSSMRGVTGPVPMGDSVNANGLVTVPSDQLAALPPHIRSAVEAHQAAGSLTPEIYQGLLSGSFGQPVGPTTTVQTAPRGGGGKGKGGGGKKTPTGAPGSGGVGDPSGKWIRKNGFLHYEQYDADGKQMFSHAFSKIAQNDPFAQGPMAPGTFGMRTGTLGRNIGKTNQFGSFGMRNGGIDPETGRRLSAKFSNPFAGASAFGGGPSNMDRMAAGNKNALATKLEDAAKALEAQGNDAKTPEAALKLKEAALKMKDKAEQVRSAHMKSIKFIEDAVTGQTKMAEEIVSASKDMADAVEDNVSALRSEIEELKAQVAELKAQATEGNG